MKKLLKVYQVVDNVLFHLQVLSINLFVNVKYSIKMKHVKNVMICIILKIKWNVLQFKSQNIVKNMMVKKMKQNVKNVKKTFMLVKINVLPESIVWVNQIVN